MKLNEFVSLLNETVEKCPELNNFDLVSLGHQCSSDGIELINYHLIIVKDDNGEEEIIKFKEE